MPEQVPLDIHMTKLFALNREHVDAQFAEIKAELVRNRDHVHRQHPTWGQLATLVVAVAAVAVPVFIALA